MKDFIIIGAGGFGREVADTIMLINEQQPTYNFIGYVDDDKSLWNTKINDVSVLGGRQALKELCSNRDVSAVMAIANSSVKQELVLYLGDKINWVNIIHPITFISKYALMGVGNIIQAFVVLAANAKIGSHCMINSNTGLGHDAEMGDYSSLMAHCDVTGNVKLGECVYMGAGSRIVSGVSVGDRAFICAGAVVFKDINKADKVMGNPARVIG